MSLPITGLELEKGFKALEEDAQKEKQLRASFSESFNKLFPSLHNIFQEQDLDRVRFRAKCGILADEMVTSPLYLGIHLNVDPSAIFIGQIY